MTFRCSFCSFSVGGNPVRTAAMANPGKFLKGMKAMKGKPAQKNLEGTQGITDRQFHQLITSEPGVHLQLRSVPIGSGCITYVFPGHTANIFYHNVRRGEMHIDKLKSSINKV